MYIEWIDELRHNLLSPPPRSTEVKPTTETNTAPVQQTIKHDWYQTGSTVSITIFAKNVDPTDVIIITKEDQLVIQTIKPEKIKFNREFHLSHAVFPDQTQIKHFSSKVSF